MESGLFAKMIVLQVELSDDPTVIKEYIDYHDNIWPEIVTDLKARPIGRMRIYNSENKLVMLFLEVCVPFPFVVEFERVEDRETRLLM